MRRLLASAGFFTAAGSAMRSCLRARVLLPALLVAFALIPVASAAAANAKLTVGFSGTGSGTVSSVAAGTAGNMIDCTDSAGTPSGVCEEEFGQLTNVQLLAVEAGGSTFVEWSAASGGAALSGTCKAGSKTNPCTFSIAGASAVTAEFLEAQLPPVVRMNPVEGGVVAPCTSGITATAACFSGTVNPESSVLEACRFEYLTKAAYEKNLGESKAGYTGAHQLGCEPAPAGIADGTSPVAVQATAAGLEPDTAYRVRLLAAKAETGSVTAEVAPFTTVALAPTVTFTDAAANPMVGSLYAGIDPNNQPTTYRFEYGSSERYEREVPAVEASAGSGNAETTVVVSVEGLSPQATYHYRVVASNATGTTEGPDQTFTTPAQPPARDYELVSSAEKNGVDAMTPPLVTGNHTGVKIGPLVAAGRVAWPDRFAAPNPLPNNGINNWYVSERGPAGWTVSPFAPADAGDTQYTVRAATPDLSTTVLISRTFDFATGGWGPGTMLLREAGGSLTPIVGAVKDPADIHSLGAVQLSGDGSHVVFHTQLHLLPQDTHEQHGTIGTFGFWSASQVYEWSKGTGLLLAGVDSEGDQLSPCGALLAGMGGADVGVSVPDISTDGSRVLMLSPDPSLPLTVVPPGCRFGGAAGNTYVSDLYLREGGTTTDISRPPAGTPDYGAREVGATPDLSQVFFVTESALPDDDPATPEKTTEGEGHLDLYRYDTASGETTRLSVAQPGGEEDAGVTQVAGESQAESAVVSEDGGTVYFTAKGQLIPGAGKTRAENGQSTANLYMWRSGEGLRYVATIAGAAEGGLGQAGGFASGPTSAPLLAVTPDGSVLLFNSVSRLTAYDNEGVDELYRYDAAGGGISCVSCSPVGAPPLVGNYRAVMFGTSFVEGDEAPGTGGMSPSQIGGLSADGSTVVFASSEPLLPAVENASTKPGFPVYNIFVWHDGALQLVSTGSSPSSDFLLGASPSGEDVYFLTSQRLLPGSDPDEGYDIYDARVGGGFPEPGVSPACVGQECRGASSVGPAVQGAASATFSGAGNLARSSVPTAPRKKQKTAAQARAEKLKKALKACTEKRKKSKRRRCKASARRRYGPGTKAKKTSRRAR